MTKTIKKYLFILFHMRREDDVKGDDDYDEAYKSAEKAYSLFRLKGEAWGNE